MHIHLIHPSLNNLWKYVSYEEVLPEAAVELQKKLQHCKKLREEKVPWSFENAKSKLNKTY